MADSGRTGLSYRSDRLYLFAIPHLKLSADFSRLRAVI